MPKARLALIVASVVALVCVPFLFLSRSHSTEVSLKFLRTEEFNDGVDVTFDVSNITGHVYSFFPLRLEARQNGEWRDCSQAIRHPVHQEGRRKLVYSMSDVPSGTRLRVVVLSRRVRRGLDAFFYKVRMNSAGSAWKSWVNPLANSVCYTDPVQIVSEEFAVP